MPALTKYTQDLIVKLSKVDKHPHPEGQVIHVSEITSLPAFIYEKLRNIVDYKDEYLLRKNAIKRYLKRKILLPQFKQTALEAGRGLVRELILTRYLPNDTINENILEPLGKIIEKYRALLKGVGEHGCDVPRWREQALGIAAVECDALLVSAEERHAYTSYAYHILKPAFDLSELPENQADKTIQLVLLIQKSLERADNDILNYNLFKHFEPTWFQNESLDQVGELAGKFQSYLVTFSNIRTHTLGQRLSGAVRRKLVPIIMMRDIIRNFDGTPDELFNRPGQVEHLAREAYKKMWGELKRRLRRKGFHALLYIFATKMLVALLLELPYEKLILGQIHYLPLAINLVFPPFLMLLITMLIKSPSDANQEFAVQGMMEAIYGGELHFYKTHEYKKNKGRSWESFVYGLLYSVTFLASFGGVVTLLYALGFNLLSGALFIFFVSLVSFFGISLRQQSRSVKVIEGKETMAGFVLDFFTLPIVSFGKWLSQTFDRWNFLIFLLDFLFEVPFKTLLKIIEDWFTYLKEKKEQL